MRQRRNLPHAPPRWVDPACEIWFVTICCRDRGTPQLTTKERASAIIETVIHRHQRGIWYAHLFLLMPDHAHGLFSFPTEGEGMEKAMMDWKRWVARKTGVEWQPGFFDHRLRQDESLSKKADYILANPVRAGLVTDWHDWPHL